MSAKLLEVRDLRVAYDKVEAVSGVSLSVDEGKIVTVIGPNGAGKTTLLSAIMGVLPSRGEIVFGGKRQEHAEIEEMVAAGMNLVPEKRELFAEMSVEDNLMLGAFDRFRRGLRDQDQTLAEVYDLFPRLRERRAQLSGTLSGGERQMLAVGRALMAKPRLLMLDEPSLGLAPRIVREVFRIVEQLRGMGVSILLIEQNARAALQVADYAYVLETGSVTLEGPAAQVAEDPRVVEVYLGLGHAAPATA
ncbi:MAG: ABC transporter ATP-binding protein [Achromobacter sp.]|jgi:branched-chain amino acid transport system ATP-binding protein|uniref:High-affinity branched-chain amino acid transport ATP-binding protein LivF n=1 Tax=Achromobacter insuavis TaxID=1287735 RepID=A0A6J4ZGX6_9BURK|nr:MULTISPECIES: ABC transporter ATP-binding protein [Achromobacter]MBN9640574.1 ABC transporter ATP-binding protein [Achromobacter sp.]MCG2597338.1 ABC transporter ATP-binding protein [Achromobacter sp.]MCG2606194.1 ABC transporter ATP-binding protein [Achromobacter sp.]CAB3623727.1 High-affinity branched-chain amino acid transport ATP-binding protein LivF [Achromobacter insuavis]CAB3815612.1 High-affinity branched-chain amino acid transport ATP-binding protein LivF [Achromobacter insuavis]